MAGLPWKPLKLRNLDQQIDQAFDELVHAKWGLASSPIAWQPDIDLFETEDMYFIEADVPGVFPQDLHVEIEEHSVTISGVRRSGSIEQSAHGVRIERRMGSFSRRFQLPQPVDPAKMKRFHHEGTLQLTLPKRNVQTGQ